MEFLITSILGVICIILGISHCKGNLSSLHSYHTKRVLEKDRIPFGKLVGSGTIIIGVSLLLMGILQLISEQLKNELYLYIGGAALIIGVIVGLGISFYAMFKYNKGIF